MKSRFVWCAVVGVLLAGFSIPAGEWLSSRVRADYTSQAALAVDVAFQARVKIAAYNAAINITSESTNATNHARRTNFAQAYAQNPDMYVAKLAFGVAADPTILAGATDAAIQNRVNAIWDTYAGKD